MATLSGGCSKSQAEKSREDSLRADSIARAQREANDLTTIALAYADSVLATMPLDRRAAMLLMPAAYARDDDRNLRHILNYADSLGVGGIVLLKGNLTSAAIIADTLASLGGPGFFLAVDAENGLKMRFQDAPEFPWNRELGRLTDDQVMYEFGRELSRECRIVGINMVLGPVMDVVPGEKNHGLMRRRSLGSDPKRVAELAIAYSRGIEDGNVISVAKHFPGHGSANADSHKALGEISHTLKEIDSIDLYPFRRYVEEGLSGVMVGHLSVKALDSIRRPAVISPIIMKNILRDNIGFRGLVITDALNMEGALGVSAWQAIAAGADIIIAPTDTRSEIQKIIKAVNDGHLSKKIIDDRCRRILFYKYLVGAAEHTALPAEEISARVNAGAPAMKDSIMSALHYIYPKHSHSRRSSRRRR